MKIFLSKITAKQWLIISLVLTTLAKLFLAFKYDTADTGAMNFASGLFLEQVDVYNHPQVNFSPPPFSLHVFALIKFFANISGIPFEGLWKLPAVFSDIGIGILIYFISQKMYKRTEWTALRLSLWYIVNPITLYVSGFHGQSESVWVFLVLLAWYFIIFQKRIIVAAVIMALAIAYKLPAILLFPALFLSIQENDKKILFAIFVGSVTSLSFLPEIITSFAAINRQVLQYSSIIGIWGFSGVLSKVLQPLIFVGMIKKIAFALKVLLFVTVGWTYFKYYLSSYKNFFDLCLVILVLFLVFTPGFGTQYLLWPLPFLVITQHRILKIYTILTTFAFMHTYGIDFVVFNSVINFLQKNLYYKTLMIYPYDLYFPIWILLLHALMRKNTLYVLMVRADQKSE